MAMVVVDASCLKQADSHHHVAWSEGRRPLGAALHSPDEPSELSQWPGHDDSTINIVVVIIIIIKNTKTDRHVPDWVPTAADMKPCAIYSQGSTRWCEYTEELVSHWTAPHNNNNSSNSTFRQYQCNFRYTKIKTRTRIIGRRFQRTRTRIIVIQKTKTK